MIDHSLGYVCLSACAPITSLDFGGLHGDTIVFQTFFPLPHTPQTPRPHITQSPEDQYIMVDTLPSPMTWSDRVTRRVAALQPTNNEPPRPPRGSHDDDAWAFVSPVQFHSSTARHLMFNFDRDHHDGDPIKLTKVQDFLDLFATLVVSLPLLTHRVRFTRIEHSFTTEEAITNLGSLKFQQSNRMPDPKDASRIVTTTTTTTFSMAREMARSVCGRFLEARLIESHDGRTMDFKSKGTVWQLTPKGMNILGRFCQRNGIQQRHVSDLLESPRNMMQLVLLERSAETDKLNNDVATVDVLFRRFAGETGPNVKARNQSDSDSLYDYATGYVGVKMTQLRQRGPETALYTFTGKAAYDWLMDCTTVVDKREVFELANQFVQHEFIEPYNDEASKDVTTNARFVASRQSSYAVTEKGQRTAGWIKGANGAVNGDLTLQSRIPAGVVRDSNTNRMQIIIRDPALRLLFGEYLRETHCEENLAFYVDVSSFLAEYEAAKRAQSNLRLDYIRETLAGAYSKCSPQSTVACSCADQFIGLYNAFLAPGSPCELNIDHNLRNALAARMTKAVGEDEQMVRSLDEVATLFEQAKNSVFKLMASDSVPKFSRESKYATIIRERNMEGLFSNMSIS